MPSSDETHGSQQLQHKGFGPVTVHEGVGLDVDTNRQITHFVSHANIPGIPTVETKGDLIHAAWMSHHKVKTRLKQREDINGISQTS